MRTGTRKDEGARRIVQLTQSYGETIDGVGSQAHITSEPTESAGNPPPPTLQLPKQTMKGFTDLGVSFAYMELDVRFYSPATPEKLLHPRLSDAGGCV